jgi:arabinan endo-1,5-alpha-L-arabinosidase
VRRPAAITLFTAALAAVSLVGAVPATAVPTAPVVATALSRAGGTAATAAAGDSPPSYSNPLDLALPGGGQAASCADPFALHGQQAGDTKWYLYCTTDALRSDAPSELHYVPTYTSTDLVHWTYAGDAFSKKPKWLAASAGVWAPDVVYRDGKYFMYYTASDTTLTGGGSAIGLATSSSPTGPWKDTGTAVVPPTDSPGSPGTRRWEFDPEVISAGGTSYIYFGSYVGGIFVRQLSADGTTSIASSEQRIAIDNRYEGTYIVQHGGYYYFMGSASNCCNGPLTGYSVFAARSTSPLGPFVDKDGRSILDSRVGGTPMLAQNGNRWVGAGHNGVVTDFAGQDWVLYHAVDRTDPYYSRVGYTKRPALLDPLDWQNGWPVVRGDAGPSDSAVPGPAAQPGEQTAYQPVFVPQAKPGTSIPGFSEEFSDPTLSSRWKWIRQPAADQYSVSGGTFDWKTQAADLQPQDPGPLASVLTEPAPTGDYVVDTRVSVTTPPSGCCQNYVQGGLIVYGSDGNYVRLTSNSIWNTRQTEFGRHVSGQPAGYPAYGNGVVGPVGDWTYLRIVKHSVDGQEAYTAYTSLDGTTWDKGDTWTASLGTAAKIGLISLGGAGFTARFDYVHVSQLSR